MYNVLKEEGKMVAGQMASSIHSFWILCSYHVKDRLVWWRKVLQSSG